MNHLTNLSESQLYEYAKRKMPLYRTIIGRLQNLLKNFVGKFTATASGFSDVKTIDVNTGDVKIRVGQFKAPNFNRLKSHLAVMNESDNIDELEFVVETLKKSESAEFRKRAKELQLVLDAMVDRYNAALDALEEVADKHLPEEVATYFKQVGKAVGAFLTEARKGKIALEPMVLIDSKEGSIRFAIYYDLSEYNPKGLWLIATSTLQAGTDAFFERGLAVSERMLPPYKADPDDIKASTKIELQVRDLLASKEVARVFSATPLANPRALLAALRKNKAVKSVEIDDTDIIVEAPKGQATVKDLFHLISSDPEVRTLMRKKHRLEYEYDDSRKAWVFNLVR